MNQFRFLEWQVYSDARDIFSSVLVLVSRLPREYRFELGSQIVRASFSIVLNIAEGSGKTSDKELNRYIEIALGSVSETLAALDVFRYNAFVSEEEFNDFLLRLSKIAKELGGFKKKIIQSR